MKLLLALPRPLLLLRPPRPRQPLPPPLQLTSIRPALGRGALQRCLSSAGSHQSCNEGSTKHSQWLREVFTCLLGRSCHTRPCPSCHSDQKTYHPASALTISLRMLPVRAGLQELAT